MLRPHTENTGLNADGLLAAVALRDQSIQISKIADIKLHSLNRSVVTLDDNPVPQDLKVIAKYLKAPAGFLASADQELAQYVVDHQLKKVKSEREIVFRNNKAVGDQPINSLRISGEQLVEKLIAGVGEVRNASFYDLGNYVDITLCGDAVTLKPKVDDITEGGLRLTYSEIMARQPSLEPYVERLICTNGMRIADRIQGFEFDTMDEFLSQFDSAIVNANKYVETAIAKQLQKAAETKVERSEQAVRTIFTNARINPRLLSGAIAALAVEDDGSAFGVLQAITRAANTSGYSHRLLLQDTAAKEMARLETVHCPTCWSEMVH